MFDFIKNYIYSFNLPYQHICENLQKRRKILITVSSLKALDNNCQDEKIGGSENKIMSIKSSLN